MVGEAIRKSSHSRKIGQEKVSKFEEEGKWKETDNKN